MRVEASPAKYRPHPEPIEQMNLNLTSDSERELVDLLRVAPLR
jgi:hypothetical protein